MTQSKFRLDRLASIISSHTFGVLIGHINIRLPILMYHSVSDRREHGAPYYCTVTTPEVFANQARWLHRNGFDAITLSDGVQYLEAPSHSSRMRIVLTFDDGFQDFYTNAFPILERYGFRATMFLSTGYVGTSFQGVPCLNWSQIRKLQKIGVEFGSHTVTHPRLRELPEAEMRRELGVSKHTIEEQLGSEVTSFSCPYAFPQSDGQFRQRFKKALSAAGYRQAVTTSIGTTRNGDDPYLLKRLPINSHDDLQLFRSKIESRYDWMRGLQYISRVLQDR